MRQLLEGFIRSKAVMGCAAIAALVLLCVGATIVFGQGGGPTPVSKTQLDTRPSSLTVTTGGNGVSPTSAAAALQSPSSQSDLNAAAGTQSTLMGETGGVSLQAGVGDASTGVKTDKLVPPPGFYLNRP